MYIVKLTQLLRAFHISEQNGIVHLELLHTPVEEPWTAYLHMSHGEVASCSIHSKNDGHILLQNTKALQWLDMKEGFVWTLGGTPTPIPQLSPTLPPPISSQEVAEPDSSNVPYRPESRRPTQTSFPVRQVPLEPKEAPVSWMPQRVQENIPVMWPRTYIRIFALIDGQRTSEQIAELLHISPERVLLTLRDLQAKRVVK